MASDFFKKKVGDAVGAVTDKIGALPKRLEGMTVIKAPTVVRGVTQFTD